MPNRDWSWKTIPQADYDVLVRDFAEYAVVRNELRGLLDLISGSTLTASQWDRARTQLIELLDWVSPEVELADKSIQLPSARPSLLPTPPPPLRLVRESPD